MITIIVIESKLPPSGGRIKSMIILSTPNSRIKTSEYYKTYGRLFGDTYDSTRYAMTPTKLCERGFDLSRDSESESPKGHEEGTDSSDGPTMGKVHSSMYISDIRSGEKRKVSHSKGKGK